MKESDKALYANRAAVLIVGMRNSGKMPKELAEEILWGIFDIAKVAGVSPRRINCAADQLLESKDAERWVAEMTK